MIDELNIALGIDDPQTHLAQSKKFTVGDLLRKNARVHDDETAVVDENDSLLTYGELNNRVNRLGNTLLSQGYSRGDNFAIISENRPEFVEVYYTAAKLGIPLAAINWRLEREAMLHCLGVVDVDLVFVSEDKADAIDWIDESDDLEPEFVRLDTSHSNTSYQGVIDKGTNEEPDPSRDPNPEDIVAVLYTSGTTGLPKGAAISHRAFLARAHAQYAINSTPDRPDVIAWPPMFHMASADPIVSVALTAGTYHTVDGFKIDVVLDKARKDSVGTLPLMPATIQPVLDYIYENDIDAESMDIDYLGSQPDLVAPNKIAEISDLFDAEYINSFGATETGLPPATGNFFDPGEEPDPSMLKTESPLCDVKLVDEDWNNVPVGEPGELAIKGPTLFSGYVGNQEANEADFKNGWFRMGDMFVRREDGNLQFVDRRKYLIKSGGENIYPAEIEKRLMDHPDVNETIAVRVSDETWGEVPKVYVASAGDLEKEDILDILEGEIAGYKLPHYVEFVDQEDFPRSTSGKIQRRTVEGWPVSEEERVRNP